MQQLLGVVIRWQALRFTGLQIAVQALCVHLQAGVGRVQQIHLRQFAATELGQGAREGAQQRRAVRCPRQTGELRQQPFGIDQRLGHASKHHALLMRIRR
ncbi:hypothetical protein D3C84_974070 [compost metagenome]